MRPIVVALATLLAVPAVVVSGGGMHSSPAAAAASTATGPSGLYEPVDRIRALDTRNTRGLPAHGTARLQVTGLGTVPPTDVVAISVNLTVLTPAVTGSLSAFADGASFSGATMSFRAGQTDQNFETVPVGAGGRIDLRNNTGSPLFLIVDILGYHTSGQPQSAWGRYQPTSPTRLLDTRRILAPLAANETRRIQVTGQFGVPQGDGVVPVINFTVQTPKHSGSLTVGEGNLYPNTPSISFVAGQTEQGQLLMGLDNGGALPIRNNSSSAIEVIADMVGYYTGSNYSQAFEAYDWYTRSYDSRKAGSVPRGGTVVVPTSRVGAVSLNVTVLSPSTDGSITIWPANTPRDTAATISFTAGQTRQRMLMAKAGPGMYAGDVQIRNNSGAPITLIVDFNGYSA